MPTKNPEPIIINLASKGKITDLQNTFIGEYNQINIRDSKDNTALILASAKGHVNVVKWLIKNSADVNLANRKKETALMKSIEANYVTITEILLSYGADVNLRNIDNNSPLIFASKNGHVDIVRSLIQEGADLNARDKDGNNALMVAIKNNQIDIITILLENGININSVNNHSETALSLAIHATSSITVIDILLKYEANLNIKDKYSRTPLFLACQKGNIELILYLIQKGSNIHDIDNSASNLLNAVCTNGPINALEYLLSLNKLDINNQNIEGLSPLMDSILNEEFAKVRLLVENGANLDLKDVEGNTAYSLAKVYHPSIAAYLKEQKNIRK